MTRHTILFSVLALLMVAGAPTSEVAADEPAAATDGPSLVTVSWPASAGEQQRPAVEFDHARHTAALQAEGCTTCHLLDDAGLHPGLAAVSAIDDRGALVEAYHDACIGCHQRRRDEGKQSSGPLTCGACHVRNPAPIPARVPLTFDLSLHARHAQAYPDNCGACHHVWDEATEKLVYRENTEEACRACHGTVAVKATPSLRDAVHQECVACHLERAGTGAKAGPVACEGCHDPAVVAAIEQLAEVPRLKRGQPDVGWVKAPGAVLPLVVFDHVRHERIAASCSTCHHRRLQACADCHGLRPAPDGGGVNLEEAHHDRSSPLSCDGCHQRTAELGDCAGCHRDTTVAEARDIGCTVCHDGPRPPAEGSALAAAKPRPPVELAPLPEPSDDLPETVTIDVLADQYQASTIPHLKIVRRFDDGIRRNVLASRFHVSTGAMCAGCHHHSPVGERPPRCAACHGDAAAPTSDAPSLKVAYHRQCLTCHQRLGIKAGCTDCHAAKEGTS